ncbi:hypothetical protein Ddc_00865 [Ditylenchus destructor]|nr:hypothetical protein Ddc_00865 [Ditylenchus destructor]
MKTVCDGSGEIETVWDNHRCTIKGGSIWPRLLDSDGSGFGVRRGGDARAELAGLPFSYVHFGCVLRYA